MRKKPLMLWDIFNQYNMTIEERKSAVMGFFSDFTRQNAILMAHLILAAQDLANNYDIPFKRR